MEPFHTHRNVDTIKTDKGFTLAELLIVFAIIVIVTGIVISNQSSFNKTIILTNTTYDIALTLRSAETYGLGGHAISTTPIGYGVHFASALPKSFVLFSDTYPATRGTGCHTTADTLAPDALAGNCVYDSAPSTDAVVSTYTLGNNISVSKFCGTDAGGITKCSTDSVSPITSLDVVFARPNPDPLMSVGGSYSTIAPIKSGCLTVTSLQGGSRYISIAASGQINANATSCP